MPNRNSCSSSCANTLEPAPSTDAFTSRNRFMFVRLISFLVDIGHLNLVVHEIQNSKPEVCPVSQPQRPLNELAIFEHTRGRINIIFFVCHVYWNSTVPHEPAEFHILVGAEQHEPMFVTPKPRL